MKSSRPDCASSLKLWIFETVLEDANVELFTFLNFYKIMKSDNRLFSELPLRVNPFSWPLPALSIWKAITNNESVFKLYNESVPKLHAENKSKVDSNVHMQIDCFQRWDKKYVWKILKSSKGKVL